MEGIEKEWSGMKRDGISMGKVGTIGSTIYMS